MRPSSSNANLPPEEEAWQKAITEKWIQAYLGASPILEERMIVLGQLLIDPQGSVEDPNLIALQHTILEDHPILREYIQQRILEAVGQYYIDSKIDFSRFSTSWKLTKILAWGYYIKAQSLQSLDLSRNVLDTLSSEQWAVFFQSVKNSGLRSLNLSWNGLNNLISEQWTPFFRGVKNSDLQSLNLSGNVLNNLSSNQWTAFFRGLKDNGLQSLNLRWNGLNKLSPEQWASFVRGVQDSGLQSLGLSRNNLYNLTPEQWNTFTQGLANSGITTLDVSENQLTHEQIAALKAILFANRAKKSVLSLKALCLHRVWTADNTDEVKEQLKKANLNTLVEEGEALSDCLKH